MSERLKVLTVGSHPDDETIFMGGTIAKFASDGAQINLLVLSDGEKGKMAITQGERGVVGYREVSNQERSGFAEQRKIETLNAAEVLGISHVEFLGYPDQGVDVSALPLLKQKIQQVDPHVILTFNEAGTTAHPDHSWTGLLTFFALQQLLTKATDSINQLSFSHLLMFTMPEASKLLEKYGELVSLSQNLSIDVNNYVEVKKQAAACYQTQFHLMIFYQNSGILGSSQEHFIERIKRQRGEIIIDNMPRQRADYTSSCSDLFDQIQARCDQILVSAK